MYESNLLNSPKRKENGSNIYFSVYTKKGNDFFFKIFMKGINSLKRKEHVNFLFT